MERIVPHVPVISDVLREMRVPLSPVVKANGFVFVSGLPPLDLATGKLVRGDRSGPRFWDQGLEWSRVLIRHCDGGSDGEDKTEV